MAGYRVKIKTGQDCESYVSSVTICKDNYTNLYKTIIIYTRIMKF